MYLGQGLASLGICGVVGVALVITNNPACLLGLIALVIVWGL